jgi:hypothetical protein
MDLPVTGIWLRSKLPLMNHGVIEPVRTCPAACMIYMESQASSLHHFWPNPETAVKMKSCRWTIPEDKKKKIRKIEWKKIIEMGLEWGSTWYSIRPRVPILPHHLRLRFKRLSRDHAMKKNPTWDVIVSRVPLENIMETLSEWLDIFGPDCIWWSNRGLDSWAGEPVMYCLSDEELASAYTYVNEKYLPVTTLIGLHP